MSIIISDENILLAYRNIKGIKEVELQLVIM